MHVVNQAMKDRVNDFQKNSMLGYTNLQEEEKLEKISLKPIKKGVLSAKSRLTDIYLHV